MHKKILIGSLLLLLSLFGCQSPKSDTKTTTWTKDSKTSPPAIFNSEQFVKTERSVWVAGELVHFSNQQWGPARVEGGSLQLIENTKGQLQYGKAKTEISPDSPTLPAVDKLEVLHQNRFVFLENLKKRNLSYQHLEFVSEPTVTLFARGGRTMVAYSVDFLSPKSQTVERIWVSPQGVLLRQEPVSSDFDVSAWIFTLQNHEMLQEVLLKNLIQGPGLSGNTHDVVSLSPLNASTDSAPWHFALDDPRFDQVQAFYYINQGLAFFARELDFRLPVKVDVQTSIGYPDKTNAAFTYQNQIRFGTGDGVVYGPLTRDPSIVIHELGHILTNVLAHLSTQGEGGSLNEAFADFFAASSLNSPKMGSVAYLPAPYKRNLEDVILFSDRNQGLYHDSQIVSGTLWEIRERFGANKAQQLALKTLIRLGPSQHLEEFVPAIKDAAKALLSPEEASMVSDVLRKRNWPE